MTGYIKTKIDFDALQKDLDAAKALDEASRQDEAKKVLKAKYGKISEEEKEKAKMSIKNETPLELFNRLIKSILALQKIHEYELCKDFDEGVRIIGDALLVSAAMKQKEGKTEKWKTP